MKKLLILLMFLATFVGAFTFQSVTPSKAKILQNGENARFCSNCGMDLVMFYKTNHAAKIDGKVKQFCSMHCLAEELKKGSRLTDIKVVDAKSLKWTDAKKAHYVVGSRVKGTMTRTSKYAFANISDAKEFQHLKGGKIMNFEDALDVAKKDFAN